MAGTCCPFNSAYTVPIFDLDTSVGIARIYQPVFIVLAASPDRLSVLGAETVHASKKHRKGALDWNWIDERGGSE